MTSQIPAGLHHPFERNGSGDCVVDAEERWCFVVRVHADDVHATMRALTSVAWGLDLHVLVDERARRLYAVRVEGARTALEVFGRYFRRVADELSATRTVGGC